MDRMPLSTIYEYIERAIKVDREMFLDRQYVVRDGEIVIVDEFTGRLGEGRKWRAGIHQAVEAKEGVEDHVRHGSGRADHRAGLLPALQTPGRHDGHRQHQRRRAAQDLHSAASIPVPTNRPPIREKLPTLVFGTADDKWQAIVDDVVEQHAARPAGADRHAVDRQERACSSQLLDAARHRAHGAQRPARRRRKPRSSPHAGQQGKVTVATNMAGRGTDIRLGAGVHELGGLHVICTELHEVAAHRPPAHRPLRPAGRPRHVPPVPRARRRNPAHRLRPEEGREAQSSAASSSPAAARSRGFESLFYKAQRKVERRHFRDRKVLLYHEKERQKMQRQMGQDPYLDTAGSEISSVRRVAATAFG